MVFDGKKKVIGVLPKWLRILVAIFLVGAVIIGVWYGIYIYNYQNKIFKGVYVGELYLGGKTKSQARALLQARADRLTQEGVDFVYKDNVFNLNRIVSTGAKAGLAYEIWLFDIQKTADDAFAWGREGGGFFERLNLQLRGGKIKAEYEINEEEVMAALRDYFADYENPGKDARLVYKAGQFEVEGEKIGQVFDYEKAKKDLLVNLTEIGNRKIKMNIKDDYPKVVRSEAEELLKEANDILSLSPLGLIFEKPEYYTGRKVFAKTQWWVDLARMREWLAVKSYTDKARLGIGSEGRSGVYLGVNKEVVSEYLREVAAVVDTLAKDARFEVKDGRVVEWQSSEDGFVLNIPETIKLIENNFIREKKREINLVLSVDKSKITNDNVNNLGIRELVGAGESDFSGSPANRRHNIAVGAASLNGILIKPGEEFSLIGALGDIDAEAGYKPELVIKGGRTVPEYGGGLCQIGTTLFRAVINTGLPVTQRRNHSYRVSYYEPAGTDATIYDPWPDFRFVNDTKEYLLLQARIEGDKAIFEFWGTGDGRVVETTDPVIYNIVAPGEPRIIETDELEPGEKKKVESAHSGADAYFDRVIEWPDSVGREKVEERFSSHYVPWREVWLVGRSASSTEEMVE